MFISTDGPGDLIFLTWVPDSNHEPFDLQIEMGYQQLADCLLSKNAILLHERVYGDVDFSSSLCSVRNSVFSRLSLPGMGGAEQPWECEIPPTYVQGTPLAGGGIAGIHAVALQQSEAEPSSVLQWQNRPCGRVIRGRDALYLSMSDVGRLVRTVGHESPAEEARKTFEAVEQVLDQAQWSFNEVRRTWFYLHNILDWYNDFNQVRNEAFKRLGMFNGNPLSAIPASTGIQGRNADGGWCTLDLLAMRARNGQAFETKRLINPKQNEAPQYGSAFARALSVKAGRCEYLFVSGTASIDEQGVSVFEGDFEKQTLRTLENVQALLSTAGADLQDICQATSFIKRPEDIECYHSIAHRMGLDRIPAVCMVADVCRDELLFELDATALLPVS